MEKDEHGHIIIESHTIKKYRILGKFLRLASTMGQHFPSGCVYIETHTGTGKVFFKDKSQHLNGSSLIALDTQPKFNKYYFIDNDKDSIDVLEREIKSFRDQGVSINVIFGDCNKEIKNLIEDIPKDCYYFAFIDPEGYDFQMVNNSKLDRIN